MSLLVRGGRVVDPARGVDERLDVWIEEGRIARVEAAIEPPRGAEVIDAEGLVVAPGLIDAHVHVREPGFEYRERLETTLRAAAAGGFTAIVAAPGTRPAVDDPSLVGHLRELAGRHPWARLYPMGCLSKGAAGDELAEIGAMTAAGAVAFTDSPRPVLDPALLRRGLQYAAHFSVPVVQHAEDPTLAGAGVMHEGRHSTRLGLPGIPALAEDVMVARDLLIAADTAGRYHLAHVSTARALERVRDAKAEGLAVSCDVTPHHLLLSDREVVERRFSPALKSRPPLRPEADVEALRRGLADGTVDAIASDHSPYHPDETDAHWSAAPFGVVGLETTLGVCLDRLVRPGIVDLPRLIDLLSAGPARLLGLPGGSLAAGAPADLTLIDLEREVTVRSDAFQGRARSCPFDGWALRGAAVATVVGGRRIELGAAD